MHGGDGHTIGMYVTPVNCSLKNVKDDKTKYVQDLYAPNYKKLVLKNNHKYLLKNGKIHCVHGLENLVLRCKFNLIHKITVILIKILASFL